MSKTNNRSMTVFNQLVKAFPPILYYSFSQMGVVKTSPQYIVKFLFFLKMHSQMLLEQLIDLSAIDFQEKKYRFEVYYHLLSIKNNFRLLVTTNVNENAFLNSVTSLFSSANWLEREVWDMFGIFFWGHPDLRRILTDYGFKGHPLRKDFPMTGFVEIRYDSIRKRICYEPVSLAQEYRVFKLENAWVKY